MKKLKFPVIKEPLPAAHWLSMDNYLKFVALNLKYIVNKKAIKRRKQLAAANVPFLLK